MTNKDLFSQVFSVGAEGVEPPPWHARVLTSCVEPSTLEVDIADGSGFRAEPSTLMPHIADGSVSRREPSTLRA